MWPRLVHAYLFGEWFESLDELLDFTELHMDEIVSGAKRREPEALLKLAVGCSLYVANETEAPGIALSALEAAKEQGLDLGRYWYGYGYSIQQLAMSAEGDSDGYWFAQGYSLAGFAEADEALDAFSNALTLGKGEAAFNIGQIRLLSHADLCGAVDVWKLGRDEYSSDCCRIALEEVGSGPDRFSASIRLADGSEQVIFLAPDGFGLQTTDLEKLPQTTKSDLYMDEAIRRAVAQAASETIARPDGPGTDKTK